VAKVLLVEDDNNLREIYQARLMAEGYDIVTAQNGEEALVVAKQNKPDLIISDVMMPRISGFEMLDILRNTNELKNTKVIMLTALGQDDDQKRAGNLGANRYLVKSQVTLEDIVNAAKELLSEDGVIAPEQTVAEPGSNMVAPAAPGIAAVAHVPDPMQPSLTPTMAPTPVATPPAEPTQPATVPTVPITTPAAPITPAPIMAVTPTPVPTPVAAAPVTPVGPPATVAAPTPVSAPAPEPAVAPTPVATPVTVTPESSAPVAAPTSAVTPVVDAAAQGLEAEEAALQAQIASYAQASDPSAPAVAPANDKAATDASNDQTIADAVQQLDSSSSSATAVTPTPVPTPVAAAPVTPVGPPATVAVPTPVSAPAPEPAVAAAATSARDSASVSGKKVIQPISDPTAKPDLNALLAKEEAANPPAPAASNPAAPTGTTTPGQTFDPSTSL
jgi:CheY-like chemotaxis protein